MSEETVDFLDGLLKDIPAEEVKDERLGTYPDAVLLKDTKVNVRTGDDNQTSYSLEAHFQVQNDKGKHIAVAFIGIPNRSSEQWQKNFALRWLHAFGLLPITNKNVPVLPDGNEDVRRDYVDRIAVAFNTKVGETVAISIAESKKGFVNVNPGKAKVMNGAA